MGSCLIYSFSILGVLHFCHRGLQRAWRPLSGLQLSQVGSHFEKSFRLEFESLALIGSVVGIIEIVVRSYLIGFKRLILSYFFIDNDFNS